MQTDTPTEKELMSVEAFLEIYSLARSTFYGLVKSGEIKTLKLGTRTYISKHDAQDWLKRLREANRLLEPTA